MPRQYYWIVAHEKSPLGGVIEDTLVFGSDRSENEARQKGLTLLSGIDFEIKQFPTRDLGTASAMYKGKKLESTHSLHEAKRRLTHEKGLERKKKRLEKRRGHDTFPDFSGI